MNGQRTLKKRIRKAYEYLIKRECHPNPDEIREKIREIGHHRVISIVIYERRAKEKRMIILTGQLGRKHATNLVFHKFPSGQVRHIPITDIIDIIEPVYENPYHRRIHNDQE